MSSPTSVNLNVAQPPVQNDVTPQNPNHVVDQKNDSQIRTTTAAADAIANTAATNPKQLSSKQEAILDRLSTAARPVPMKKSDETFHSQIIATGLVLSTAAVAYALFHNCGLVATGGLVDLNRAAAAYCYKAPYTNSTMGGPGNLLFVTSLSTLISTAIFGAVSPLPSTRKIASDQQRQIASLQFAPQGLYPPGYPVPAR